MEMDSRFRRNDKRESDSIRRCVELRRLFESSRLKGGEKKGNGFFGRYRSFRMTLEDVYLFTSLKLTSNLYFIVLVCYHTDSDKCHRSRVDLYSDCV